MVLDRGTQQSCTRYQGRPKHTIMIKIFINYVKSKFDISKKERILLDKTIRKYTLIVGKLLNIPYITITVYPKPSWTIPETGEGGYTVSEDWIRIAIDPKSKKYSFKDIIKKHLPATIYHEMNHIARCRSVGYGDMLLEAVISEGIASVFEKEQWKTVIPPWAKFNEKEIANLLKIVRERNKKKDRTYNHGEWFLGKGKLPRWTGYKVGTYIIESVRKNSPEISWQKLTKMRADKVIKKGGIKI